MKPTSPKTPARPADAERAQTALENVRDGYGHAPADGDDDPPGEGLSDRALDDRPPAPPVPTRRG